MSGSPILQDGKIVGAVTHVLVNNPTGWGGAGVMHTSAGNYFTSVSIDTANAPGAVCGRFGGLIAIRAFYGTGGWLPD